MTQERSGNQTAKHGSHITQMGQISRMAKEQTNSQTYTRSETTYNSMTVHTRVVRVV